MGTERTPIDRVGRVDLRVIDRVLAVLLTIGALADAASQPHRELDALAIVSCVVLTGSVAWRRRNPVLTTTVAITGLIAFQLASGYAGDGSFEVAAIALNFYLLGRRARGRVRVLTSAAVLAYWLAGAVVVSYSSGSGSVVEVVSSWTVLGGLPFFAARTLATRGALARELEASAARLEDEQETRARRAAAEERNRMARELHDVIAHNVSVMVIQTSAARRVARADVGTARAALQVVEGSGRDALVELRRIVGVLRRRSDEPAGSPAPRLRQLNVLADRARAAGLPVDLRLQGESATLSPGLDLVAYRIVQEALTNAIKHAGPASAQVKVNVDARELTLSVTDTGRGPANGRSEPDGSGHGLLSSRRHGPLLLNMALVAAMALAAIGRRRSPLSFLILVGVLAEVLTGGLHSLRNSMVIGVYTVLVPTYTVAAWENRRRAVLGLTLFLCGAALQGLILNRGTVGYFAGGAFTLSAAWAAGRAIRSRRVLTSELLRRSERLAAERDDRECLAVVGERTRIARELHAVVAQSVAAMVVQAEAAQRLLAGAPAQAETGMSAIEDTGRRALVEMRRILGVLRHTDEVGEREPQPGVDQIYTLIQRAREHGQPIELSIDGEPGTLPAGVDLGIYRILEEALGSARRQPGSIVEVALRFGEEVLELHLTAGCEGPSGWPTLAMRERIALCGGEFQTESHDDHGWGFVARMPRGLQGAFV